MFDWQRVDGATLYPFRCLFCVEQRDVLDTMLDLEVGQLKWGRVYVCKNHARTGARLFGLSKGKEQERLLTADDALATLEKERDEYKKNAEVLGVMVKTVEGEAAAVREERDNLRGRVKQLEYRLAQEARAALELVGGDAA